MAESGIERAALLRREYLSQTSRIRWHDLQTSYAHGTVVNVTPGLDLVDVAVQLGLDNVACFQGWIESGEVTPVNDQQALAWYEANEELWAVVAPPWVLVQYSG
ncbi:MAG: DUF2288 domain-containing protein [Gammaproteobacteria bacterium]|nr:MAG: DUF2288 domain-containing protein [Gammaproteobacteria bacterium]RLA62012.1 MAG: DUF2288 domain-containing protein [Gammaproteobacteria bacterium]HDY83436.1 DUF2288 family protein [Halieaceae bacterium]